ncbi:hypothetical protein BpHYR1_023982 [Brachionus plicatilis]|uniref:Uncharacterized protein n=1 Tax=Brachionus plicatilis TaxID=10195 RepID=A0A3M7SHT5_BRAPC|nr:hypothetical protein BpHYR1_023982 [Brachionus plicatilis]
MTYPKDLFLNFKPLNIFQCHANTIRIFCSRLKDRVVKVDFDFEIILESKLPKKLAGTAIHLSGSHSYDILPFQVEGESHYLGRNKVRSTTLTR